MDKAFIKKLTEITESNLSDPKFGVVELANEAGTSYSNLRRKVHSLTGKSVNQFIREIRLDKAMELMQQEELTAAEVSFKTGFSSPAWFSNCFRQYFGYPPGEVRKMQLNNPQENDREKKKAFSLKQMPPGRAILLGMSAVIAAALIYPRIFNQDDTGNLRSADGRISIAIMPFQNRTDDAAFGVWGDVVQENLINFLSNSEELDVKRSQTMYNLIQKQGLTNYASITPEVAGSISKKLDARVYIFGSIIKSNETIRINAQLANSKTEEMIQSFEQNGTAADILKVIDSIKVSIRNYLEISVLKRKLTSDLQHFVSTTSPEAFEYYILGQTAFFQRDNITAMNMFKETLKRDSNFYGALFFLSVAYLNQKIQDEPRKFEEAKKYCLKVFEKKDQMSLFDQAWVNWLYFWCVDIKPLYAIKYLNQLVEMDNQQPNVHYQLGLTYNTLHQFHNAIPELKKALEVYHKWDTKPMWAANYYLLGDAFHKTGQFKKEKKIYQKAQKDFPADPGLTQRQAILALSQGDTAEGNRFISKYKSIIKDNLLSEAEINSEIALIYSKAGIPDKAEKYFRKALFFEPESPARQNALAYFLIDNERDIHEGMELVNQALESSPGFYEFLATKGWGLFKLGKFQEACEILQKSYDLRMRYGTYFHPAFLNVEEAKKAVANHNSIVN